MMPLCSGRKAGGAVPVDVCCGRMVSFTAERRAAQRINSTGPAPCLRADSTRLLRAGERVLTPSAAALPMPTPR